MLETQKFLVGGKSHDDLAAELGIKIQRHEELPLVILNYDQIESPKTHPVVREWRGLVLHAYTHGLVARSFSRFFNWGEVADEAVDFDFSDFIVQSKEDGSLAILYHFDGRWHANTRGSFGLFPMEFQDFNWRAAFCKAMGINSLDDLEGKLVESVTYVCEFCSPWNKIVRTYDAPQMYLLTAFDGLNELSWDCVDKLADPQFFKRPLRYEFSSIEEVQGFLQEQAEKDPTFEGVVIRDVANRRWKIKSATYLGLHRLKGEGDNMYNPKHLLPFVLAGEEDELLTYFPEVTEKFYRLKCVVLEKYAELLEVWADHWRIEEQKDFALAIQGKTPFTGILFNLRKAHKEQRAEHLRKIWRESDKMILNNIGVKK
jgi:hypothetical protein